MAGPRKKAKRTIDEMAMDLADEHLVAAKPDMDNIQQLEWVAEVMTHFAHAINPLIDKGTTYEIMLQVMYEGLDQKNALKWGAAINQTQYTPRYKNKADGVH